jgi:hypothetical protein
MLLLSKRREGNFWCRAAGKDRHHQHVLAVLYLLPDAPPARKDDVIEMG